jgi:hypothetical protein
MYSNANREENLEILLSLTDNKSIITINETLIRQNWLTKPETLGDVAIIQILNIIQKKVKGLLFDEKDYFIMNTKDKYMLRIESIKVQFDQTDLINRMLTLLESQSSTKKDVAILILVTLSNVREFLNMMMKKEIIKSLILHLHQMNNQSIKRFNFRIQKLQRTYDCYPSIIEKCLCERYSYEKSLSGIWRCSDYKRNIKV